MQAIEYLIIGVGNTLRGDDGAGWLLAEAVGAALNQRGKRTQIRRLQQLLPELAAEIAEAQPHAQIFTDCSAGANDVGQISPLSSAGAAETSGAAWGSHGLTPAQLLTLANRLYDYSGVAWLATVPGFEFGHGEGLSPATAHAIDYLTPQIIKRIL
jgi:hydrogenase maturation protease